MTYKIQDFEKHQDDEAVIEWTRIAEGLAASTNQGRLVPWLEQRVSKKVLRIYADAVALSSKRKYHVADVGDVKVRSSRTEGDRAELSMCMWSTTTGVRDENDRAVGDDEGIWFRQDAVMSKASGQWVLTSIDGRGGTCRGGPPT
ncbi:hypothetical protein [Aeromicrobium endophyticum]|uniref:hypothetical protein n=1 Tax=Aeromicrobium endophyticum TaxID=2292704 RepID=UPI0011C3DF3E|nr:hypothetical protein [Aeromicrobium endophyticum]